LQDENRSNPRYSINLPSDYRARFSFSFHFRSTSVTLGSTGIDICAAWLFIPNQTTFADTIPAIDDSDLSRQVNQHTSAASRHALI
jgi:hypothetical protein